MKNFRTVEIITIILSLFITRIIFLKSNVFSVDGDEAILGLMALDILDGKFPLYFYGQTYGLSIFEVLPISLWIKLFGVSNISVKIPMLLIFGLAIFFLSRTIQKLASNKAPWIPFLFIFFFILSPTWLVWSLKARGGYLTSFLFSSLSCYLLVSNIKEERFKFQLYVLLAISLIIIFEAQPLWLPPLLPLGIWFFLNNKLNRRNNFYAIALIFTIPVLVGKLLKIYKQTLESSWNTPSPNPFSRLTEIPELVNTLLNNLGGNYYLSNTYIPNNQFFALIIILVFLILIAATIFNLKILKKTIIPYLGISAIFSLSGFFFNSEPRYLLPFFSFFALFFFAFFIHFINKVNKIKWSIIAGSILILVVEIFSISTFSSFSYNNMKIYEKDDVLQKDQETLSKLLNLLKSENIKYVYSTNELLQYQVSFFSRKQILATSQLARSRTPWISEEVLSNISANRNEFAVIGYNFNYRFSGKLPLIQNKIYYLLRPENQILKQLGLLNQKN